MSAPVDIDGCDFVGADSHSSANSEAAAIVFTLLWLMRQPICVPATIHFDATIVGFAVAGYGSWSAAPDLLRIARGLARALSAKLPVHWKHVKAHAGHEWNELADTLAKISTAGRRIGAAPSAPPTCWINNPVVANWAWLHVLSPGDVAKFGLPIVGPSSIVLTAPRTSGDYDFKMSMDIQQLEVSGDASTCINLATCNVRSLFRHLAA